MRNFLVITSLIFLFSSSTHSAVFDKSSRWDKETNLQIWLTENHHSEQHKVLIEKAMDLWLKDTNLSYQVNFGNPTSADEYHITVSSKNEGGNWSYIGKASKSRKPSMNLAIFAKGKEVNSKSSIMRIVYHEFGHALGLNHEHQNPSLNLTWNQTNVLNYCNRVLSWENNTCIQNILTPKTGPSIYNTDPDKNSVMMYHIYAHHNDERFVVMKPSTSPSKNDLETIRVQYPLGNSGGIRARDMYDAVTRGLLQDFYYYFEKNPRNDEGWDWAFSAASKVSDIAVEVMETYIYNEVVPGMRGKSIDSAGYTLPYKDLYLFVANSSNTFEEAKPVIDVYIKFNKVRSYSDFTPRGPLHFFSANKQIFPYGSDNGDYYELIQPLITKGEWNEDKRKMMEYLIENGANIESPISPTDVVSDEGWEWRSRSHTMLMHAAENDKMEAFKILTKHCLKLDYQVRGLKNRWGNDKTDYEKWFKKKTSKKFYKAFKEYKKWHKKNC